MGERRKSLTWLLNRAAGIEPDEAGRALTAFLMFFLVLGSYFAVRPVRETVGTVLGRNRTAELFVWTWALSMLSQGVRELPVTDAEGVIIGFVDETSIAHAYIAARNPKAQPAPRHS